MNKFNEAVCRINVPCNQNRSQANKESVFPEHKLAESQVKK